VGADERAESHGLEGQWLVHWTVNPVPYRDIIVLFSDAPKDC